MYSTWLFVILCVSNCAKVLVNWYVNHICNYLRIPTTAAPVNQQFDPFYYVITGDAFSLNCIATGNPNSRPITFSWYRNSKHITDITRIIASDRTSRYMKSVSQLNIKKLDSDQHSGRYICVANNKAISTTRVFVES